MAELLANSATSSAVYSSLLLEIHHKKRINLKIIFLKDKTLMQIELVVNNPTHYLPTSALAIWRASVFFVCNVS